MFGHTACFVHRKNTLNRRRLQVYGKKSFHSLKVIARQPRITGWQCEVGRLHADGPSFYAPQN